LAAQVPADPAIATASRSLAAEARMALERANDSSVTSRRALAWCTAVAGDAPAGVDLAVGAAGLQDPESTDLLRRIAALAVGAGDLPTARRALLAAHASLPQEPDVLADLAAVELALGEAWTAAERLRRALTRRPDDLSLARDLAGALLAAGHAGEATALLASLAARPDAPPDLALDLAQAALEAGETARAEQVARSAMLHADPHDGRPHALLGAALAGMGRRAEAIEAYQEALRRDPSEARARTGLTALTGSP
jgi:tetratricopeptide (TPR) repeat protein